MGEPPSAEGRASLEREQGERRFVYEVGSVRVTVAARGRELVIPYSTLHEHGIYEHLDRIVEAWWALAPEARVESISIAYRYGDPYETYQLRPVP